METLFSFDAEQDSNFIITIFGVGKTGCHVVDLLHKKYRITDTMFGTLTLNYVVISTDIDELKQSCAAIKLQFDGSGFNPVGAGDPQQSSNQFFQTDSYNLGYIVGDLDEELTPEIAQFIANQTRNDSTPLTIGVVPKQFAENSDLIKVKEAVSSLIVVDGDLFATEPYFDSRDEALAQPIMAISEMITHEDGISIDLADINATMKDRVFEQLGFGIASGKNRAEVAVERALAGAMLNNATLQYCLVIFSCLSDATMGELDSVALAVGNRLGDDAEWFLGFVVKDEGPAAHLSVTIIA